MKITVEQISPERAEEVLLRCHDPKEPWVEEIQSIAAGQITVNGMADGKLCRLKLADIPHFREGASRKGNHPSSAKRGKKLKKLYEKNELILCAPVDRGLLRPAISDKSAQQKDRSRILGKCCFLHLAGGHSYCLYPKKPFAKAIRALQIARSRLPISLLCAAAFLGIREPLERHCAQLFTARNHLPYCVYAMRWFLGGSDLPGLTVCSDCKGQCQVCHCHIKRNFWHRTYHQPVQRQRYGTGQQPVPDRFCDCGGLLAGHDFLSRRQPAALHPRPFRHQHPWYICQRCWSDYGNALTASRCPDCNYGCLYPDPDKNAPEKSKENTQMMPPVDT